MENVEEPRFTITGWKKYASIEPAIFIVTFAMGISDIILVDMINYQTCRFYLGFDKSKCDILHHNSSSKEAIHLQELIQPHSGVILTLQSCIDTIFPAFLSIYLGPWSDQNGRKPILCLSLIGFFISFVTLNIESNLNVNPYWILLSSVPSSFFGGYSALLMSCICYVNDISNNENRSWRLALFDSSAIIGSLLGMIMGPIIFNYYGYSITFGISAIGILFSLFYSIFCIPETIQAESPPSLRKLFDNSLAKELFIAVTRERENFNRGIVWCCIFTIVLHVVCFVGNKSVLYMFTTTRLGWGLTDFSIFGATNCVIYLIGTLIIIKLIKALGLPDTICIFLGSLSMFGASFAKAFTLYSWNLYMAIGLGMFVGAVVPILRSIISKSVPAHDIGKVFSLLSTIEMIVPFLSTPIYVYVYTKFEPPIYPCPVWFIPACLSVVIVTIAFYIHKRLLQNSNRYTSFVQEEN